MRNNKKLFLIAGLISVSMLTGCGNATEKENDTKAETSADESTAESTEAAETEDAESEDTMARYEIHHPARHRSIPLPHRQVPW